MLAARISPVKYSIVRSRPASLLRCRRVLAVAYQAAEEGLFGVVVAAAADQELQLVEVERDGPFVAKAGFEVLPEAARERG